MAIEVTFNGFIEPVCLPQSSQNEIAGVGTVVGWGTSETSEALNKIMDTTPNELNMPIISYRDCFLTTHELAAIASNRTFCAGFSNQSKSICTGDAGAGFYSFDQDSGLTSVKGMASASLKKRGSCNKEFYAIYTKVVDFMEWIKQEMKNH